MKLAFLIVYIDPSINYKLLELAIKGGVNNLTWFFPLTEKAQHSTENDTPNFCGCLDESHL